VLRLPLKGADGPELPRFAPTERSAPDRDARLALTNAATAVMGTGIVSVALARDGREVLSSALLATAGAVWVAAAVLLLGSVWRSRRCARGISPLALTSVAATAVLGTSLAERGWDSIALALLAVAAAFWLTLIVPALRSADPSRSTAALMLPVATQALATLCAELGAIDSLLWLVLAALAAFVAGLVLYAFAIARFALRQLIVARGEHWVAGGALAVSSIAASAIIRATERLGIRADLVTVLKGTLVAVSIAAFAWLAVLIVAECLAPRLRYDTRRWSTVFPVGMYAACGFATGAALHASPLTDFARVWVWIALAVWGTTLAGAVRAAASPRRIARARRLGSAPTGLHSARRSASWGGRRDRRRTRPSAR
jgi:hypothetical protein